MSLIDGQYRYDAANGLSLVMGAGTPYRVQTVTGLRALGSIAAADTKRTGQHGTLRAGRRTYGLRIVQMDIVIEGNSKGDDLDVEKLLDDLYSVMQNSDDDGKLVMKRRAKAERFITCSPRIGESPATYDSWIGWSPVSVQLAAEDPLVYGMTEKLVNLSANIAGGRVYPRVYPLIYPGGIHSASAVLKNEGTIEVPPQVHFVGPIINPGVVNLVTGQTVMLNYTLAGGMTLDLDFDLHSILLNGVSRRSLLDGQSDWWKVQPGDNEISMVGTGTGSATVSIRDAWPAG